MPSKISNRSALVGINSKRQIVLPKKRPNLVASNIKHFFKERSINYKKRLALVGAGVVLAGATVVASFNHANAKSREINAVRQSQNVQTSLEDKKVAVFKGQLQKNEAAMINNWKNKQTNVVYNFNSVLIKDLPKNQIISSRVFFNELTRFSYSKKIFDLKTSKRLYDYCIQKGISPSYMLSLSRFENRHASDGVRVRHNKNIFNIRAKKGELSDDLGFRIFPTFEAGFKAGVDLIASDVYAGGHRKTVSLIAEKFAPKKDGNKTNEYIQNITVQRQKLIDAHLNNK
ncbi:MAG: hypothetical protein PHQ98_01570 [Candidatus ainarchaeum sp.]|nr:hypothetical protein [Candidatus ainarchaeum sp.]